MQRPIRADHGGHPAQRLRRHRPHRVHGRTVGPLPDPGRPAVEAAPPEATLHPGKRPTDPAGQVQRVQQHQPDADPPGRLAHRVAQLGQVVELADRGPARAHQLGVDRGGEPQITVGVQPPGDVVHRLPPAPERPTARRAPAAQRPVEGMAVHVGDPGEGQPGQPDRLRQRRGMVHSGRRGDHSVGVLDEHARHDPAVQPGQLAPEAGAHVSPSGSAGRPAPPWRGPPGSRRPRAGAPRSPGRCRAPAPAAPRPAPSRRRR